MVAARLEASRVLIERPPPPPPPPNGSDKTKTLNICVFKTVSSVPSNSKSSFDKIAPDLIKLISSLVCEIYNKIVL